MASHENFIALYKQIPKKLYNVQKNSGKGRQGAQILVMMVYLVSILLKFIFKPFLIELVTRVTYVYFYGKPNMTIFNIKFVNLTYLLLDNI